MLTTPLVSAAMPESVLTNPWMRGIFGQMFLCLPGETGNYWHVKAAEAATYKDLSLVAATFSVATLQAVSIRPRSELGMMKARDCLREIVGCLADPGVALDTLERLQRTAYALSFRHRALPENSSILAAMSAAVSDAVEMRKRSVGPAADPDIRPHLFGKMLPHVLNVMAWRNLQKQFPRPEHGYAEERFLELERQTACVGFGESLLQLLRDAPYAMTVTSDVC